MSHQKRSSHYKTKICKRSLVVAAVSNVCFCSCTWHKLGSSASFHTPECCQDSLSNTHLHPPKTPLHLHGARVSKRFHHTYALDNLMHQTGILAGFISHRSEISDLKSQQSRCVAGLGNLSLKLIFFQKDGTLLLGSVLGSVLILIHCFCLLPSDV